jgi:hypothetical protein
LLAARRGRRRPGGIAALGVLRARADADVHHAGGRRVR